jgi:hypothetical protein
MKKIFWLLGIILIASTLFAQTYQYGHVIIEGVTSTGATGTGNIVFATSPAFTTPNLGTPSAVTIALPLTVTGATSGGVIYASSTTGITSSGILNANIVPVGGGAGAAPTNSSITDNGTQVSTSEVIIGGNTVHVGTANFTTASTSLVTITGLTWTFPAANRNYAFNCRISYSQATAAALDAFGVQATTTAPTNLYAAMRVSTGLAVTGVDATLPVLATTTATNIGTFTPSAAGAIGTVADIFVADVWGYLEQGAGATTLNIMALSGSGSDSLTIYRGSSCTLMP